mmetsp:Transcript_86278/g.243649  ORF Transcript_86278/g.243649 Transcript_86278/m.243649 type:complete len:297 (-) Transcript_86278:410-1300(-)
MASSLCSRRNVILIGRFRGLILRASSLWSVTKPIGAPLMAMIVSPRNIFPTFDLSTIRLTTMVPSFTIFLTVKPRVGFAKRHSYMSSCSSCECHFGSSQSNSLIMVMNSSRLRPWWFPEYLSISSAINRVDGWRPRSSSRAGEISNASRSPLPSRSNLLKTSNVSSNDHAFVVTVTGTLPVVAEVTSLTEPPAPGATSSNVTALLPLPTLATLISSSLNSRRKVTFTGLLNGLTFSASTLWSVTQPSGAPLMASTVSPSQIFPSFSTSTMRLTIIVPVPSVFLTVKPKTSFSNVTS